LTQADDKFNGRYSRQVRFPHIGEAGQEKLSAARVTLIGCGALGSVIAETLVRAGVGFIRIVDRDFLEISNLQRQSLFNEDDVASGLPKAIAAAARLRQINSGVEIEPVVADVTSGNIRAMVDQSDLILDGTDNFEIRFLINDVSIATETPWIYGGCLGADGQMMVVLPGETACLHCLMIDGPPAPGTTETCDSFGILAPIINVIASFQAMEAIKLLSGNRAAVNRKLNAFEMWSNTVRQMDISGLRSSVNCPACQGKQLNWLDGQKESRSVVLCGRNAVQVSFPSREQIALDELAEKISGVTDVKVNAFLVRFEVDEFSVTVFRDGRAIISGTDDLAVAKRVYAQYVGN
jgi:adenylyltransferase/sulfurtransferase